MINVRNGILVGVFHRFFLQLVKVIRQVNVFHCQHLLAIAIATVQTHHYPVVDVEDLGTVVHQVTTTRNQVQFAESLLEITVLQFQLGPLVRWVFTDSKGRGQGGEFFEGSWVVVEEELVDGAGGGTSEQFFGHLRITINYKSILSSSLNSRILVQLF